MFTFQQTCYHVYGEFSRRFGYWVTGNPVASRATIGLRVTRVGCAQFENRHEKHCSIDGDVSSSNANFVCVSSSDRFSCEVPSVGGGPCNGWYWQPISHAREPQRLRRQRAGDSWRANNYGCRFLNCGQEKLALCIITISCLIAI